VRRRAAGLHSGQRLPIVAAMQTGPRSRCSFVLAATALIAVAACSKGGPPDPKNRVVPWSYGPTTADATNEHLVATGTKGGAKLSVGWQCRLQDGKALLVQPYQLSTSHPMFDKVVLSIGLYDKADQLLTRVQSEPITKDTKGFTFPVDEAMAAKLATLTFFYVAK
jgi:hypothetical protein